MPDIERVTPTEILSTQGASQPVVPGSYLEFVGVQLAIGVGGFAALVISILLLYWAFSAPSISINAASTDPDKLRQLLEVQKQARDAHLQPVTQLFDSIVIKCLLPVFTTILGYIFGSRTAKQGRD